MSELIDRNEGISKIKQHCYPIKHGHNEEDYGMTTEGIMQVLESLPTRGMLCGGCRHHMNCAIQYAAQTCSPKFGCMIGEGNEIDRCR